MTKKFDVVFLEEAIDFLKQLDEKSRDKIIYNIDKATYVSDTKLFKKLNESIWEFRTLYQKRYYRLLAFWDKENTNETLVVATHGFVKKSNKTPKSVIAKAETIRIKYFEEKNF